MTNQTMKRWTSKLFLICLSIVMVACNSRNIPTSISTTLLTAPPEQTATASPIATLSQATSEIEIRQLMQNDVDCKPPCFLGVIPGQTTVGELRNIFFHYGVPLANYQGSLHTVENSINNRIPPLTSFNVQDGIVTSMLIEIYHSNEFEWSIYYPAAVLKRFGTPSRVMFGLEVIREPSHLPRKSSYVMTFFYDDLNLIIQYTWAEIKLAELIPVCPNQDNFQSARIWLGNAPEQDHPPLPMDEGPLEEVTSFTRESFRDFLLRGPDACFELKANAIPIH